MSSLPLARLTTARRTLQPLLIGAAHAFSFSDGPLPTWLLPYIQILTLSFLALWIWRAATPRQAAISGLLFGLGNFTLGLYWIYFSLHTYGGLHAALAVAAVLIMALVLALFISLATGLAHWLTRQRLGLGLGHAIPPARPGFVACLLACALWASFWMLFEWLRGTLFTGFPWLNIGYAHADGPLAGWVPLLGAYGVAWLAAFIAASIALLMKAQGSGHDTTPAALTTACAIGLLLAGLGLGQIKWSQPDGDAVIVRLVQGNIEQSVKFDPAHLQRGIDAYLYLAGLAPKENDAAPALIILPETVMPVFQNRLSPHTWQRWLDVAKQRNATIIMGVPLNTATGNRQHYTNSVIAFNASTPLAALHQGSAALRYDKHHLVPFGEFIPPGFRWFVDALSIPLGDFDRGTLGQAPFTLAGQRIAPNICYEDVFGEEIIQSVRPNSSTGAPGASLLVNVSNLAWFGNSWALQQHLQIARMRAIETARPMLRATNTGMTAAIDPDGSVRAALADHHMGVLDVEVQGTQGLTPYVRWGNWPILILALALVALGLFTQRNPLGQ